MRVLFSKNGYFPTNLAGDFGPQKNLARPFKILMRSAQDDPLVTQDEPWVTQDEPWVTQDDP